MGYVTHVKGGGGELRCWKMGGTYVWLIGGGSGSGGGGGFTAHEFRWVFFLDAAPGHSVCWSVGWGTVGLR